MDGNPKLIERVIPKRKDAESSNNSYSNSGSSSSSSSSVIATTARLFLLVKNPDTKNYDVEVEMAHSPKDISILKIICETLPNYLHHSLPK